MKYEENLYSKKVSLFVIDCVWQKLLKFMVDF